MIKKVTFLSNPSLPGKSPILLFRNPFAGIVLKKSRSILTAEWSFFRSRKSNPFAFQFRGECEFEKQFLGRLYFQRLLCCLKKLQQFQEADTGQNLFPLVCPKAHPIGPGFYSDQ